MKSSKYAAYIIVLIILLMSIAALSVLARNFTMAKKTHANQQEITDLYASFCQKDIALYWIGTFPEELNAISSKVIFPAEVSEGDMPVKSPEFHTVEKDPNGNIVEERIPVDYPANLYIIVNRSVLSDDQYSLIRQCVVDNGVNAIFIGSNAIEGFRDFLIMPAKTYSDGDIMEYSFADDRAVFGDSTDIGDIPSELVRHIMGELVSDGDRPVEDNTDNSEG
ncbi:MAG: hypothetical protein J6Z43_09260 [Clostridiales bacterium]|nr:hypothetical protein [Clostridiales bacterium]